MAFYEAALLTLRSLDESERVPRRFGGAVDARWEGFRGHLGTAERIDLLVRDAAVTWGAGFSPAQVFGLVGLAADEPFGPDWEPLSEPDAKRMWRGVGSAATLEGLAEVLGVATGPIALPSVVPATRLLVAGGAAMVALGELFAARRELSWAAQVLVVAARPEHRQLAGLVAPLIGASGPTVLLHPTEDVAKALAGVGFEAGGEAVVSSDATTRERSFVLDAARRG